MNQPTGVVSAIVKEFDSLKDFIASASFVAFVDLPFIFLFIFVLYTIGGPVAAVPAIIVVVVIIAGLIIQPVIRRLTFNAAQDGQSKQSVTHSSSIKADWLPEASLFFWRDKPSRPREVAADEQQ